MAKLIDDRHAYESGKTAKEKGFMRTSPYYENSRADYYWFLGYDGQEFARREGEVDTSQIQHVHDALVRVAQRLDDKIKAKEAETRR